MNVYFNYTTRKLCSYDGLEITNTALYPRIPFGFKPVVDLYIGEETIEGYKPKDLSYLGIFAMGIDTDYIESTPLMAEIMPNKIITSDKINGHLSILVNADSDNFKNKLGSNEEVQASANLVGFNADREPIELIKFKLYAVNVSIQQLITSINNYVVEYSIIFDSNGGIGQSLIPFTGTSYIIPVCALAKSGFVFEGWTDGTNIYQAGDAITLTADKTLTAVWIESAVYYEDWSNLANYSIYDNDTSETIPLATSGLVVNNQRITSTLSHIGFDGVNPIESGIYEAEIGISEIDISTAYMSLANIGGDIYRNSDTNEITLLISGLNEIILLETSCKFKIKYDSESKISNLSYKCNNNEWVDEVAQSDCVDSAFCYCNLGKGGYISQITRKPLTEPVVYKYKIVFDCNGNTSGTIPDTLKVPINTVIIVPTKNDLAKTGLEYRGWYSSVDGLTYIGGENLTITSDVTFAIIWENDWKVTVINEIGTNHYYVTKGSPIDLPTTVYSNESGGRTIATYYKTETGEIVTPESYIPVSDITLTAYLEPNYYSDWKNSTIKDDNGGALTSLDFANSFIHHTGVDDFISYTRFVGIETKQSKDKLFAIKSVYIDNIEGTYYYKLTFKPNEGGFIYSIQEGVIQYITSDTTIRIFNGTTWTTKALSVNADGYYECLIGQKIDNSNTAFILFADSGNFDSPIFEECPVGISYDHYISLELFGNAKLGITRRIILP